MALTRSIRELDWPLLVVTLVISSMGVLQIYSATRGTIWQDAWWKQLVFIGIGLVLMWTIARVDYHTYLGQVWVFYGLSIAGLILVLVLGRQVFGSRRWIPIPGTGIHLQVSEFVKIVIILLVARYLTELRSDRLEIRELLKLAGLIGVPMLLVMKQPDLGTSLCYVPMLAVGVLIAGLRWQYWAAIGIVVLLVMPLVWQFGLKDYQKARLSTFMDPSQDPRGSGYQVIQSRIAVGNGGVWGKGVTRGSQTQLRFLPVPHTDFILATFAEEHGFVGVVVLLGLYFVFLMQIVQNAQMAPDRAGMYICMGVCALMLFHILVNAGMVVGRMPVVGIPLPLVSSGGSNTLSIFMMLGLVNNVRRWRLTT